MLRGGRQLWPIAEWVCRRWFLPQGELDIDAAAAAAAVAAAPTANGGANRMPELEDFRSRLHSQSQAWPAAATGASVPSAAPAAAGGVAGGGGGGSAASSSSSLPAIPPLQPPPDLAWSATAWGGAPTPPVPASILTFQQQREREQAAMLMRHNRQLRGAGIPTPPLPGLSTDVGIVPPAAALVAATRFPRGGGWLSQAQAAAMRVGGTLPPHPPQPPSRRT